MYGPVLSHDSALAYWSYPTARAPAGYLTQGQTARVLESAPAHLHIASLDPLLSINWVRELPRPVDLLTSIKGTTYTTKRARYRKACIQLPDKSVTPIVNGFLFRPDGMYSVFAVSPELCLVQMASLVGELEALELAYELCGTYTLYPSADGHLLEHARITSPDRIATFANESGKIHGSGVIAKVANWIIAGSASPRETLAAMACVLPFSRGGLSMQKPALNKEILVGGKVAAVLGGPSIKPDLYWEKQGVAIEYDSDERHGAESFDHDARKRSAYKMLGIKLYSFTRDQFNDFVAFEHIMNAVRRDVTSRNHIVSKDELVKREDLHRWLVMGRRRQRVFALDASKKPPERYPAVPPAPTFAPVMPWEQ